MDPPKKTGEKRGAQAQEQERIRDTLEHTAQILPGIANHLRRLQEEIAGFFKRIPQRIIEKPETVPDEQKLAGGEEYAARNILIDLDLLPYEYHPYKDELPEIREKESKELVEKTVNLLRRWILADVSEELSF